MTASLELRIVLRLAMILALLLNGSMVAHAAVAHDPAALACHDMTGVGHGDEHGDKHGAYASAEHDHAGQAHKNLKSACCTDGGCPCGCAASMGSSYRLDVASLKPVSNSLPVVSHYHSLATSTLLRPPSL
jgi:hypothetical protein